MMMKRPRALSSDTRKMNVCAHMNRTQHARNANTNKAQPERRAARAADNEGAAAGEIVCKRLDTLSEKEAKGGEEENAGKKE